jgi:predicted Zn-dependent peptidase
MKREAINAERLNEQIIVGTFENGLQVCVMERRGTLQTYGAVGVRCGSADLAVLDGADGEQMHVPYGIQHFLEHMMFKQPDGKDMYARFAGRDSMVNAYTTQQMTAYWFSCLDLFDENLRALLDMVDTPHFPRDLVDDEHKVIVREIGQYAHDQENNALLRVLAGLYGAEHPLATDILGTPETIRPIDGELLQRVYDHFYRPANMIVLVIGDVEAERVFEAVRMHSLAMVAADSPATTRSRMKLATAAEDEARLLFDISALEEADESYLLLGMRDPVGGLMPQELLRRDQVTRVVLQALVGPRSPLQRELTAAGLLAGDWGWLTETGDSCAYACLGGYTFDPEAARALLADRLSEAAHRGLGEAEFERARTKLLASYIRGFDDDKELGMSMHGALISGVQYFEIEEILRTITFEEANRRCRELFLAIGTATVHK